MRAWTNALTRLARRLLVGIATSGSAEDQIGRFLGLAGCDQHHPRVILQCIQPTRQVGSAVVDGAILDAAVAGEKRCANLCDEFLPRVDLITETLKVGQR